MNKETIQILIIISGMFLVAALGVAMFFASRWARKKNAENNQETRSSQIEATKKSLAEGRIPFFSQGFWTGNLSNAETILGKTLAILAIAAVLVFLGFACYVLTTHV